METQSRRLGKYGRKSTRKVRERAYRAEQSARARHNRMKKGMRTLFEMIGAASWGS